MFFIPCWRLSLVHAFLTYPCRCSSNCWPIQSSQAKFHLESSSSSCSTQATGQSTSFRSTLWDLYISSPKLQRPRSRNTDRSCCPRAGSKISWRCSAILVASPSWLRSHLRPEELQGIFCSSSTVHSRAWAQLDACRSAESRYTRQ